MAHFYTLMFAMPLAGWATSSAHGFSVALAGVIPLPPLVPKSESLKEVFEAVHGTLGWVTAALVVAHAGAALKHHFIDEDGILGRMLFQQAK